MPDSVIQLHRLKWCKRTVHPDWHFIFAADFNHAGLVIPKHNQHVDSPTRHKHRVTFPPMLTGPLWLHQCYAIAGIQGKESNQTASETDLCVATSALQDCFDTTDWPMFKQAATHNHHNDIQEYTETVTAYIAKCADDVTVTKTITTQANQKQWATGAVHWESGMLPSETEISQSHPTSWHQKKQRSSTQQRLFTSSETAEMQWTTFLHRRLAWRNHSPWLTA